MLVNLLKRSMMHILTVCWEFSPLPPAAAAIARPAAGTAAAPAAAPTPPQQTPSSYSWSTSS